MNVVDRWLSRLTSRGCGRQRRHARRAVVVRCCVFRRYPIRRVFNHPNKMSDTNGIPFSVTKTRKRQWRKDMTDRIRLLNVSSFQPGELSMSHSANADYGREKSTLLAEEQARQGGTGCVSVGRDCIAQAPS